MIVSFGDLLNHHTMFWKPSSLQIMTTADEPFDPLIVKSQVADVDLSEGETFLAIPFVDQMEVLGIVIHCTGNSFVPADHRLEKADKATWKFHNLLFCHDAPLFEVW